MTLKLSEIFDLLAPKRSLCCRVRFEHSLRPLVVRSSMISFRSPRTSVECAAPFGSNSAQFPVGLLCFPAGGKLLELKLCLTANTTVLPCLLYRQSVGSLGVGPRARSRRAAPHLYQLSMRFGPQLRCAQSRTGASVQFL
jgi:hypothetical protein